MANFDRLSRYVTPPVIPYEAFDARGRLVRVVPVPEPPVEVTAGVHVRREGQSLDQLANGYLADPHAYWRLPALQYALLPRPLPKEATPARVRFVVDVCKTDLQFLDDPRLTPGKDKMLSVLVSLDGSPSIISHG